MGSNRTENYSLAVRFEQDRLQVDVRDDQFKDLFTGETATDFSPEFIKANPRTVHLPEIDSSVLLKKVYDLDLWQSFNSRCLGCGACTAACITCSCFTTSDLSYKENGRVGERRRIWASCLHEDFTAMAGGHGFRNTAGDRMRFRTLHKVYDYQARFGTGQMCVGCGRCDDRCPELISFSSTINHLNDEVAKLKQETPGTEGVANNG
jgi:anaerobic sulfite reductase subunit A